MIPGIHNNAAGAHLKRTRLRETENIPGKLKMSMSVQNLNGSGTSAFRNMRSGAMSPDGRSQADFLNNIVSDANIEKHAIKDQIYSKSNNIVF